ncbi:MAG: hypothetical protein IT310_12990 [Anaerolineales bacterium]|nr:hypothetical protein [Anaerolineales bacterium]
MNKINLFYKPLPYALVFIYIGLTYLTLKLNGLAPSLYHEDGYFENLGALSLFIAAGLMFYAFYYVMQRRKTTKIFWVKQWAYLALALLFFFGAGEEISWGQRIFGIATPESLAEINEQDEINIHNIEFNGISLPFESEFDIFWGFFVFLIPLVAAALPRFNKFSSKFMPIVHWGLGMFFVFNYLMAKVAKLALAAGYSYAKVPFIQAVQEIKESNYEFFYIFVCLFVLLDLLRAEQQPELSQ